MKLLQPLEEDKEVYFFYIDKVGLENIYVEYYVQV